MIRRILTRAALLVLRLAGWQLVTLLRQRQTDAGMDLEIVRATWRRG